MAFACLASTLAFCQEQWTTLYQYCSISDTSRSPRHSSDTPPRWTPAAHWLSISRHRIWRWYFLGLRAVQRSQRALHVLEHREALSALGSAILTLVVSCSCDAIAPWANAILVLHLKIHFYDCHRLLQDSQALSWCFDSIHCACRIRLGPPSAAYSEVQVFLHFNESLLRYCSFCLEQHRFQVANYQSLFSAGPMNSPKDSFFDLLRLFLFSAFLSFALLGFQAAQNPTLWPSSCHSSSWGQRWLLVSLL